MERPLRLARACPWKLISVIWYIFALRGISAATTTVPSSSQLSSALASAGAGIGNNPVAQALGSFETNLSGLESAVQTAFNDFLAAFDETTGNPELQYSYGQSPPVYPSPKTTGQGGWQSSFQKAQALVSKMTLQEKVNLTMGNGPQSALGCSGFSGGVPRLGYPGMCLNDAESGVRTASLVSGYPAQLHIGASWNRALAQDRGLYIGREFKAKGANVINGPVVGPIGRMARNGRNWEGFGADPYLAGALVGPTVQAMQESAITCVKHYLAYEQETNRLPFLSGIIPGLLTQSVSSNLDDRTMHEIYLWPYYDAVKAGAGSIMTSYNRINNSYASQNSKTVNGLLKTELGFQGFVVSDWYGQHTGVASANAGLDMAMPFSEWWGGGQLVRAVNNGSVTKSRINDMATRILASWYRYAQYPTPGLNTHSNVDARDPASASNIFQGAVEGHVLLKNVKNALPLHKPKTLSIFGYSALGGRNSSSDDQTAWSYGLANTPNYTDGTPFTDAQIDLFFVEVLPSDSAGPDTALAGTMPTGGGSGATTPASSTSPFDAISSQAAIDKTTLHTDFYSQNPTVLAPNSPCLVLVNEQSSESWDRSGLASSYADTLVTNVAGQCKNTVVIIHNAGIRLVDAWIDHPNITALIFAHLPGQDTGPALVELLYGRQSPSGRLPYTVAKQASDYGPLLSPAVPTAQNPVFPQSDFDEGLYIDYKYFIKNGITPRFEFGYGLTYTTFSYSNLAFKVNSSASRATYPPDAAASKEKVAPEGGLESLYDVLATATATVTNTDNYTAAEVAQLYITLPNGPLKTLRGFDKQTIKPGQKATVTFPLRRRDLSFWDTGAQQWSLAPGGSYAVFVGRSVLDTPLQTTLTL